MFLKHLIFAIFVFVPYFGACRVIRDVALSPQHGDINDVGTVSGSFP